MPYNILFFIKTGGKLLGLINTATGIVSASKTLKDALFSDEKKKESGKNQDVTKSKSLENISNEVKVVRYENDMLRKKLKESALIIDELAKQNQNILYQLKYNRYWLLALSVSFIILIIINIMLIS